MSTAISETGAIRTDVEPSGVATIARAQTERFSPKESMEPFERAFGAAIEADLFAASRAQNGARALLDATLPATPRV